jgi:hypothetical protein
LLATYSILDNDPGGIYTSTNSGQSWTNASVPSDQWVAGACSADGTVFIAVSFGNRIYRSTDSGATWIESIIDGDGGESWVSIACSADASRVFAAPEAGPIYTSSDSGVTWRPTSSPSLFWRTLAFSADGARVVAAGAEYGGCAGLIFTLSNLELTWAQVNAPAENWRAFTFSADGSKLVGLGYGGHVCTVGVPLAPPSPLPGPHLSAAATENGLHLSWLVPSSTFILQENPGLTAANWGNVTTAPNFNFTNLHYEITVVPRSGGRFYRLKQR